MESYRLILQRAIDEINIRQQHSLANNSKVIFTDLRTFIKKNVHILKRTQQKYFKEQLEMIQRLMAYKSNIQTLVIQLKDAPDVDD